MSTDVPSMVISLAKDGSNWNVVIVNQQNEVKIDNIAVSSTETFHGIMAQIYAAVSDFYTSNE
jgi:hypothetical protein